MRLSLSSTSDLLQHLPKMPAAKYAATIQKWTTVLLVLAALSCHTTEHGDGGLASRASRCDLCLLATQRHQVTRLSPAGELGQHVSHLHGRFAVATSRHYVDIT